MCILTPGESERDFFKTCAKRMAEDPSHVHEAIKMLEEAGCLPAHLRGLIDRVGVEKMAEGFRAAMNEDGFETLYRRHRRSRGNNGSD